MARPLIKIHEEQTNDVVAIWNPDTRVMSDELGNQYHGVASIEDAEARLTRRGWKVLPQEI